MNTVRRPTNLLPFAPEPLQARVASREIDGVPAAGYYMIWNRAEGRRCGRCPLEQCTLEDVPDSDVATCVRVLCGEASDRHAASIRLLGD